MITDEQVDYLVSEAQKGFGGLLPFPVLQVVTEAFIELKKLRAESQPYTSALHVPEGWTEADVQRAIDAHSVPQVPEPHPSQVQGICIECASPHGIYGPLCEPCWRRVRFEVPEPQAAPRYWCAHGTQGCTADHSSTIVCIVPDAPSAPPAQEAGDFDPSRPPMPTWDDYEGPVHPSPSVPGDVEGLRETLTSIREQSSPLIIPADVNWYIGNRQYINDLAKDALAALARLQTPGVTS
jgi:hypothetical protein